MKDNKSIQNNPPLRISLNNSSTIRNFPKDLRNQICSHTFNILLNKPDSSEDFIMNSLINIINEKEKRTSVISEKNYFELVKKVYDAEYSIPLWNYFTDIIKFTIELRNNIKDNVDSEINIGVLARQIYLKGNLTTYKSEASVYQVIRELVDYLKEKFPDLSIKRKSPNFGQGAKDKIKQARIGYSYEKLLELAEKNKGKLITTEVEYDHLIIEKKPSRVYFKWWCGREDHGYFLATPNNINEGSWCPQCFKEKQKQWQLSRVGYTYEEIGEIIEKKGGKLITTQEEFQEIIKTIKPIKAKILV